MLKAPSGGPPRCPLLLLLGLQGSWALHARLPLTLPWLLRRGRPPLHWRPSSLRRRRLRCPLLLPLLPCWLSQLFSRLLLLLLLLLLCRCLRTSCFRLLLLLLLLHCLRCRTSG